MSNREDAWAFGGLLRIIKSFLQPNPEVLADASAAISYRRLICWFHVAKSVKERKLPKIVVDNIRFLQRSTTNSEFFKGFFNNSVNRIILNNNFGLLIVLIINPIIFSCLSSKSPAKERIKRGRIR